MRHVLGLALAGGLLFLGTPVPGAERTTIEGVGKRLDEYLSRLEQWGFSGAILAVHDGKVVLSAGYGWADGQKHVPATPDTVWNTGSITKQFTAAAILKLEMQGKISVQDPIAKYFKDAPPDKAPITLHQLLTHTAGFEGALGDDLEPIGRDAFIQLALGSKLLFPPGQQFSYSNVGFSLLAAIVELVSGEAYESYVNENLFKPAGMTDTGYRLPKWDMSRVARGSGGEDEGGGLPPELRSGADGPGWHLLGNGGILTTTADMLRWHQVLLTDRVLSDEAKKKMFTVHTKMEEAERGYGYGWGISRTDRGTTRIAHNGGNGIFAADFQRFVDENAMFFTASNDSDFPCIPLSPAIETLLFGGTVELPPPVVKLDAAALQPVTGTYSIESGGQLIVSANAGQLHVAADTQDALSALAGADEKLRARVSGLNERVAKAFADHVKGDNKALYEVNGRPGTFEEFDARNKARFQRMQDRNGPFQRFEVLGSTLMSKGISTLVKLTFEKGTRILELGWSGPEITRVEILDELPGRLFLPQSPTEFASFSPRSSAIVRLHFDGDTVLMSSGAGEEHARRKPVVSGG